MKRFIKGFIALSLIVLFTSTAFAATPKGDADGNGEFSIADIIGMLNMLSKATLTSGELYTADIDGDGACTLKDVLSLIDLMLNTDEKPSYCDVNNRYHDGCVWDHIEIGKNSLFTYTHSSYKDVKIRVKIYIPESYSPHKSYALVTHLHGLGGENQATANLSGSTFFSNIMKSDYGEDTIYLLPQCPVGMTWPDDRETITVVYNLIMSLCKHLSIDESRLYISGHSNGSKGVAYMLMEHPNTFAAAVMGSGASGMGYYHELENIATAPIWMFVGTADEIPGFLENVRNLYNALKQMGADVKLTEFEGKGHNIFSTVGNTEGLVDWVYARTLTK